MPDTNAIYPVLKNAPIVEAIAQFRFGSRLSSEQLNAFEAQLRPDFPSDAKEPVIETTRRTFASADEKRYVRVGQSDLAYHKLAPYGDGNDFRTELRILWRALQKVAPETLATEATLRAINRVDINAEEASEQDKYFNTFPMVGDALPSMLASAFMRLVIPHPERDDIRGVIVWATQPAGGDIISFIVDIEAMAQFTYPSNEESLLWDTMELLRQFRNQLFFESITEKTREMYL